MLKKLAVLLMLGSPMYAQNPQTQTAPIIPENAKYVNGIAPGYAPTAGSGLVLNLGPGGCTPSSGTPGTYAGGTLTMSASSTNYVYLNLASNCAPATKTTAFTSSDFPIAVVVAASSTITSIVDDRTMFFAGGNGSGPIAANTLFVFAGNSKNDDDTNAIEATFSLSSFNCNGSICAVVNTGTNGLSVGDWVNMRFSTAWTSTFSAPTDIALSTGYTLFKVISSGLSSTGFQFSYSGTGICSSSCGNAAKATFNLPFNVTNQGALKGVGSTAVIIPSPVTIQGLASGYSTILHPLSPAVTGNPAYLIIGDEENDVSLSGCASASTIEAAFQSIWAAAHTDGYEVLDWSSTAFNFNQAGIGACATAYQTLFTVEDWLFNQGKNSSNYANGQYWDLFADTGRVIDDGANTNLVASNGGFGPGGVTLAAGKIANVILSGVSDPLTKRPVYFGAGPSVASAGNGFNHIPSADSIYYESWWDAAFDTQVFGIGTLDGYRRFFANTAATNTITDTSGMTYGGPILSVAEGYGSYSPYVNDYPMTTVFAPEQGNGGTPFWEWGYANSTNNAINLAFSYTSAGSASNFVTLALKGTNGIKIDGSGNFYVPGLGSSTSPLCTTTGGELTIVGCVVGTTYTGTSPIVVTGSVISCPTCSVGTGTNVEINGGAALGTVNITGDTTQACADTSGSGTAQSCSTSTSFTPTTNNCVVYTTTTANSGTGLTLNVNSLGAKSAAVPSSSGWTTTLTASQIPSGTPMLACYNGTQWNLVGTGIQASSGGSANLGSLTYNASGTTTFAAASAAVAGGKVTATHSTSTTFSPTGLVAWGSYTLEIIEDSTGGGVTFTLGTAGTCSAWKVGGAGAGAITLSTGANVIDVLAFTYDGTNCVANFRQSFN